MAAAARLYSTGSGDPLLAGSPRAGLRGRGSGDRASTGTRRRPLRDRLSGVVGGLLEQPAAGLDDPVRVRCGGGSRAGHRGESTRSRRDAQAAHAPPRATPGRSARGRRSAPAGSAGGVLRAGRSARRPSSCALSLTCCACSWPLSLTVSRRVLRDLLAVLERLGAGLLDLVLDVVGDAADLLVLHAGGRDQHAGDEADGDGADGEAERVLLRDARGRLALALTSSGVGRAADDPVA